MGRDLLLHTLSGADPDKGLENTDVVFNGVASPRPWEAPLPPPRPFHVAGKEATLELPPYSVTVVEIHGAKAL